jgi:chromosome segregation protein
MSVYIKDIKIHNFKTHKSSKIKFTPGINVITGPNGSGKSNIIEAILFSLGERNPRRFRATAFDQLINKKTKDGYLSVNLTITDGEREYIFKRVITSVGKHKYYFNGRRVSRSTYLTELLRVGEEGFSFRYVPQGSVIATANMSPSELRQLIDDILGITEYNERKKKALENLDEARRKLGEVIAKAEIMRHNLSTLYEQMVRASRKQNTLNILNKLLAAELTIKINNSNRKLRALEKEKENIEKKIERLERTIDKYDREMDKIRIKISDLEKEKDDKGGREYRERLKILTDIQREINAVNLSIESLDKEVKRVNHRLKEELSRKKELSKRIRELEREINRLNKNSEELEKLKEELSAEIKEKKKTLKKLKYQYDKLNTQLKELIDGSQKRVFQALKKASGYISSQERYDLLMGEKEAIERRMDAIKKTIYSMKEYIDRLLEEKDGIKEKIKTLKDRHYTLNKSIIEMEEELDKADGLYSLAEKEVVKLKTLREAGAPYELEEDAQFIINMARDLNIKGVLGIMSDKVSGPRDILSMLQRILGVRWNSILVRGEEPMRMLSELAMKMEKRVVIINVSSVEATDIPAESILSLLKYPKYLENLLGRLIGRTLIVNSIERGIEKAIQGYDVIDRKGRFFIYNQEFHIGERWIKKKGKGRIRDLEGILKDFKEMIKIRKRDLAEKIREREEVRDSIIKEEEAVKRINEIVSSLRINVKVLAKVLSSYTKRHRKIRSMIRELEIQMNQKEKEIVSLAEILAKERRELEEQINNVHDEINVVKDEIGEIEREIKRIKMIIKNNGHTVDTTKKLIEGRYVKELNEIEEKIMSYKSELIKLVEEKKEKAKQLTEYKKKEIKIQMKIDEIEDIIGDINKKISALKEEENNYYVMRRKTENEKSNLDRQVLDIQNRINQVKLDINRFREERRALGYPSPVYIETPKKLHKLINDLQDELREIGEVNPLAKSYYIENVEPYKHFSMRREELLREEKAILEFIDEIDRQREKILREGLEKINTKMNRLFKQMFGDSKVNLELEDPEDIDSGLVLMVELPGKPLLPASSLSGGEKSLVLVTFLIAINALNPNTVLLLDEIDAHIDPHNLSLFTDAMISEKISNQLIMVSLKPSVIEIADNLVGVTIRDGVSKTITLPKTLIRVREEDE